MRRDLLLDVGASALHECPEGVLADEQEEALACGVVCCVLKCVAVGI